MAIIPRGEEEAQEGGVGGGREDIGRKEGKSPREVTPFHHQLALR